MKRCVIVGGAKITNYPFVRSYIKNDDYFIFCDSGLNHIDELGVKPNLVVGDFDSFTGTRPSVETIELPCEKDDTDTVFAVKEALKRGFCDFLLLGVIGERFDHTLGNVGVLLMLDSLGKTAILIDDYSEMEIVSDCVTVNDTCSYFSILNISGTAEGIDIENAKYPLKNATITCTYPIGICNEVLPGQTAIVTVRKGNVLLIKIMK